MQKMPYGVIVAAALGLGALFATSHLNPALTVAAEKSAPPDNPGPPAIAPSPAPPAAPESAPAAPPAPPRPSGPVGGIRNKIAAGDLLSAESILEVHRAEHGEDPDYLTGLSWLARGALLLQDLEKAERYAAAVRARCAKAISAGARLEEDRSLETALGAAIEVEAQLAERRVGARKAAARLKTELDAIPGPVSLRSRLNKRINMLTLAGSPAPELVIEDFIGEKPPSLASLRGRPVVLFLWAEWCGDCKAQVAVLARARERYTPEGVAFVALTRYYDGQDARPAEKERVAAVWESTYADVGSIPIVISTGSMERYGGSSTPTFVFIDRGGIVRRYTPTRLTEAEFDRAIGTILRAR